MEISFDLVSAKDSINTVEELANEIWRDTYENILPDGQVDYMLQRFQSAKIIEEQINREGFLYMLIRCAGEDAGYYTLRPNFPHKSHLLLSKLYLHKSFRGRGVMGPTFTKIFDFAKQHEQRRIWLAVNKQNAHAQNVYTHFNFVRVESIVKDIGNGYVMDDYVYECLIEQDA